MTKTLPSPPISCVVYTPRILADAIVSAVAPGNTANWLEPSCGGGAFLSALNRYGASPSSITAVDLSKHPEQNDRFAKVYRGVDFHTWNSSRNETFDCIVGNPPYLHLSTLPSTLRLNASQVTFPDGTRIDGRGNTWLTFIAASLSKLSHNGNIGFVLPAAAEYANYARYLRDKLPQWFREVCIHRCAVPLFDNVKDGSIVLIAKGWQSGPCRLKKREHKSMNNLVKSLSSKSVQKTREYSLSNFTNSKRLGDVIEVKIGAVTGDVKYFVLSEAERTELEIPKRSCVPILSRAQHLYNAFVDDDHWKTLLSKNHKVWLFRPKNRDLQLAPVRRYLRLAPEKGGCNRDAYKVSLRKPWYHTSMPLHPDAFISGLTSKGPWLALNTSKHVNATNTLYVAYFKDEVTESQKASWAISLMSTIAFQSWTSLVRKYPDGLCKLEPSDIESVQVPIPRTTKNSISTYKKCIKCSLNGDEKNARKLADKWLNA
jgi:adenine-specific DNA-methyltransferase